MNIDYIIDVNRGLKMPRSVRSETNRVYTDYIMSARFVLKNPETPTSSKMMKSLVESPLLYRYVFKVYKTLETVFSAPRVSSSAGMSGSRLYIYNHCSFWAVIIYKMLKTSIHYIMRTQRRLKWGRT